jgi:hypothetical protein
MIRIYCVYQVHLNVNRRREVNSFAVARELGQDNERNKPGYIIPRVSKPEDEKFCVYSMRYPVQCFHRPSFTGYPYM